METPKDEIERDDLASPSEGDDESNGETAKPVSTADTKAKPKDPDGEEDSYEDGWYQVLKRRAGEAADGKG